MPNKNQVDVVISLGSNIERERHVPEAVRLLRRHRDIEVIRVSRIYESDAVEAAPDTAPFFNAALLATTPLDPETLRDELRHIESVLLRERSEDKNAPRTIDLDVSYYGREIVRGEGWTIPDASVSAEAHVAIPIADVAPDWKDPHSGRTAFEIATDVESDGVQPISAIQLASPNYLRNVHDWDYDDGDVYAPRFEGLVRQQLLEIGEDPEREGLLRTPLRVAKAMDYLTSGYATSLEEVVNNAIFDAEGADEMVLVKDIEFYSMCEHHMLPFFGKAAVAYLPKGHIIGLSKLARIVDLYARRLQVQERMTNQIAGAVERILDPHGVAVIIEGRHFCMMMRGVQKQDSSTVTSAMLGTFKSDARTRSELLDLVRT